MSNVIQFLESMGGNAQLARMSIVEYQAAVSLLAIGSEQQEAMLTRDASLLGKALCGTTAMFCLIVAPDSQEERTPGDESDGEERSPNDDDAGKVE